MEEIGLEEDLETEEETDQEINPTIGQKVNREMEVLREEEGIKLFIVPFKFSFINFNINLHTFKVHLYILIRYTHRSNCRK